MLFVERHEIRMTREPAHTSNGLGQVRFSTFKNLASKDRSYNSFDPMLEQHFVKTNISAGGLGKICQCVILVLTTVLHQKPATCSVEREHTYFCSAGANNFGHIE